LGISKGSGSRFEVRNEWVDGGVVTAVAAALYGDLGEGRPLRRYCWPERLIQFI